MGHACGGNSHRGAGWLCFPVLCLVGSWALDLGEEAGEHEEAEEMARGDPPEGRCSLLLGCVPASSSRGHCILVPRAPVPGRVQWFLVLASKNPPEHK